VNAANAANGAATHVRTFRVAAIAPACAQTGLRSLLACMKPRMLSKATSDQKRCLRGSEGAVFSLAARKVWVTDPNRGVERRKGLNFATG
jgi:hypothetical protein